VLPSKLTAVRALIDACIPARPVATFSMAYLTGPPSLAGGRVVQLLKFMIPTLTPLTAFSTLFATSFMTWRRVDGVPGL
jgi:hypothetical protein